MSCGSAGIRLRDGRICEVSGRWFALSLLEGGLLDWDMGGFSLAGEVGHVVAFWLNEQRGGEVLEVQEVERMIAEVAEAVGILPKEMGCFESFQLLPPPVEIELEGLAERAGDGFELAFFGLLRSEVASALKDGARIIECRGSRRCVKRLLKARSWNKRCRKLLEQIVNYLRGMNLPRGHGAVTIGVY
ncbi:MAG: hypothetical protein N2035_09860 [Chthoniobacterales bacterium]|nr:hypothetical protein [Chthoniobacterales bacterium]